MICAACGYKDNEEGEHRCARCGRRLDRPASLLPSQPPRVPPRPPVSGGPAAAVAPHWRHEVNERFEQFQDKRARRREAADQERENENGEEVPRPDPSQKLLSFEDFAAHRIEPLIVEPPRKQPAAPAPAPSARAADPVLAGETVSADNPLPEDDFPREILCPNPVAPVALRGLAGALDLAVTTVAVALFLGTFHLLGGALHFDKRSGAGYGLAAVLLLAFYFFVYTFYGSETPGLQWLGLCVLDFDGSPPRAGRRLLRTLGAMLSAAALGLGYFWALADEEGLTWHDRMSKTFVTRDPRATQHFRPRHA